MIQDTESRRPNSHSSITDLDLAAYGEGFLSPQRRAEVDSLLSRCPELRDLVGLDQTSSRDDENREAAGLPAAELPAVELPAVELPQRVSVAAGSGSADRKPVPAGSRKTGWWIRAASVALLCLVLIGGSLLRTASADVARLDHLEQEILADQLVPGSEQSRVARQTLQNLGDSLLLSPRENRRRKRLLATMYLADARVKFDRINLGELSDMASSDAVNLCLRVIDGLTGQQPLTDVERQLLVEAWWIKANVEFAFGTVDRADHRVKSRLRMAADSLLSAAQICEDSSPEFANLYQLKIRGLLTKVLHKGGEAALTTDAQFHRSLRASFPELNDVPIDQTIEVLARNATLFPGADAEHVVALLNVKNVLAMRLLGQPGRLFEAENTYRTALEMAAAVDAVGLEDAVRRALVLIQGRLLGNLADLYSQEVDLDAAARERDSAIRIFKNELRLQRNNELFYELGWVTGRQILAQYCRLQRGTCDKEKVVALIGALDTLSGGFQSMDGFQLGPQEVFFLHTIRAECTAVAGPQPQYSDFVTVPQSLPVPPMVLLLFRAFAEHERLQEDAGFQAALEAMATTDPQNARPSTSSEF